MGSRQAAHRGRDWRAVDISNWLSVWSAYDGGGIGIPPVNQLFWISHSTGLMSMTGVPSMASIGPIRKRFLLILRTVT